ncbi:hypothetical protein ACFV3E_00550, partial [Streptomyces sp. NPDC059718]
MLALTAGEPDAALAHFRLAATPARTSAPQLASHNGTGIALAGWPTVLVAPTAQACGVLALTAG